VRSLYACIEEISAAQLRTHPLPQVVLTVPKRNSDFEAKSVNLGAAFAIMAGRHSARLLRLEKILLGIPTTVLRT